MSLLLDIFSLKCCLSLLLDLFSLKCSKLVFKFLYFVTLLLTLFYEFLVSKEARVRTRYDTLILDILFLLQTWAVLFFFHERPNSSPLFWEFLDLFICHLCLQYLMTHVCSAVLLFICTVLCRSIIGSLEWDFKTC